MHEVSPIYVQYWLLQHSQADQNYEVFLHSTQESQCCPQNTLVTYSSALEIWIKKSIAEVLDNILSKSIKYQIYHLRWKFPQKQIENKRTAVQNLFGSTTAKQTHHHPGPK